MAQRSPTISSGRTKPVDSRAWKIKAKRTTGKMPSPVRPPLFNPIPNAPPALTRFATAAPPTIADLRLSFDTASQAALKVSQPDTEGKPFLDRVMARLQDFKLITAAAALAHAQMLLDAGDLDGAVKAVSALSGPPAEKMAPWLADATALQAAREALASLAEKG